MALVRRVRGRRRERTSWVSNRDLLSIKFLPFNHKCGCECDSEIVNVCVHCHWVKSWRRELWVTTCDKESWKEIGRVMVEKDAEGEEDALVNSSTGFKERSRGFGSQKDGDSTSCRSGCCASLGTICCRGHRRKDNKGKYAACQWFEFDKRCVKMCSHDFSQETSSGCVTQKPSWFEVKSVEQGGGVAYTGTVVQKSVQREPQAAVGSQLPELCKTGAGSRAHCLWTTVDPGFPGNHLLALGSQFWPCAAFFKLLLVLLQVLLEEGSEWAMSRSAGLSASWCPVPGLSDLMWCNLLCWESTRLPGWLEIWFGPDIQNSVIRHQMLTSKALQSQVDDCGLSTWRRRAVLSVVFLPQELNWSSFDLDLPAGVDSELGQVHYILWSRLIATIWTRARKERWPLLVVSGSEEVID